MLKRSAVNILSSSVLYNKDIQFWPESHLSTVSLETCFILGFNFCFCVQRESRSYAEEERQRKRKYGNAHVRKISLKQLTLFTYCIWKTFYCIDILQWSELLLDLGSKRNVFTVRRWLHSWYDTPCQSKFRFSTLPRESCLKSWKEIQRLAWIIMLIKCRLLQV